LYACAEVCHSKLNKQRRPKDLLHTLHPKKRLPYYFSNNWFLVCEILRKFDIDSLYICPPYLYTVTTLPWEIQKNYFSTVLLIETSDYYIISEETNCNCCIFEQKNITSLCSFVTAAVYSSAVFTVLNTKHRINTRCGRTDWGTKRIGYLSVDVRQLAAVVADNKLGIQWASWVTEVQSRRRRNRQIQSNCWTPVRSLISWFYASADNSRRRESCFRVVLLNYLRYLHNTIEILKLHSDLFKGIVPATDYYCDCWTLYCVVVLGLVRLLKVSWMLSETFRRLLYSASTQLSVCHHHHHHTFFIE